MKRPGIKANAPATATPIIVPIIQAACDLTRPLRMEMIAAAIEIRVHNDSPWSQLNDPSLSSRIQNDETATHSIAPSHAHPKTLCRKVPLASARFALPRPNASTAVVRCSQIIIVETRTTAFERCCPDVSKRVARHKRAGAARNTWRIVSIRIWAAVTGLRCTFAGGLATALEKGLAERGLHAAVKLPKSIAHDRPSGWVGVSTWRIEIETQPGRRNMPKQ